MLAAVDMQRRVDTASAAVQSSKERAKDCSVQMQFLEEILSTKISSCPPDAQYTPKSTSGRVFQQINAQCLSPWKTVQTTSPLGKYLVPAIFQASFILFPQLPENERASFLQYLFSVSLQQLKEVPPSTDPLSSLSVCTALASPLIVASFHEELTLTASKLVADSLQTEMANALRTPGSILTSEMGQFTASLFGLRPSITGGLRRFVGSQERGFHDVTKSLVNSLGVVCTRIRQDAPPALANAILCALTAAIADSLCSIFIPPSSLTMSPIEAALVSAFPQQLQHPKVPLEILGKSLSVATTGLRDIYSTLASICPSNDNLLCLQSVADRPYLSGGTDMRAIKRLGTFIELLGIKQDTGNYVCSRALAVMSPSDIMAVLRVYFRSSESLTSLCAYLSTMESSN